MNNEFYITSALAPSSGDGDEQVSGGAVRPAAAALSLWLAIDVRQVATFMDRQTDVAVVAKGR